MRDPKLAGLLSLIVPGVGQLYNGRVLADILWLVLTPGFWIGTGGTLGWICHIVARGLHRLQLRQRAPLPVVTIKPGRRIVVRAFERPRSAGLARTFGF